MNIYKNSRSTHIRLLSQNLRPGFTPSTSLRGFTIVELIVAISIIAILAAISIVSYGNWQQSVVTAQLKSDLSGVATAMESYRNFNNGYPTSIPSTFSPSAGVTISGGSIDGGKTYCADIFSSKFTNLYYHIDSTNRATGAQLGACGPLNLVASFDSAFSASLSWDTVAGATSYTLQRDINSDFSNAITLTTQAGNTFMSDGLSSATTYYYRLRMNIHTLDSAWSTVAVYTTMTPPAAPIAPIVAVSLVGGNASAVITPVAACAEGILQYGINDRINDGTWSGWTSWSTSIPTASQVANDGMKYGYQARTRCYLDPIYSTTSTGAEASYTDPINVPAVPTVAVSTVVDTTTFSWGAATCTGSGNTARYQYRYTITPSGYDSGLVASSNTSVAFTTSTEGQTYTVQVQAECYSVSTASGMSAAGSGGYYHSITQYTLAIVAGTGGTVNAGGTYNTGTVRTITATPNSFYSFSSWSGSTGCSGIASHTITMDSDKTCTANFIVTAVATPSTPTVVTSLIGSTSTFSWGAATCTGGNTARYQYRYTIAPSGYDSGWVATAGLSVAFTTATGNQTYTVQTQGQCYNIYISSSWSGSGTASYFCISDANPIATSISGVWSSAPTGYLLEDGTAVSRTTYADLFAVIGTTYGTGDGSTTFNLPDSRGRVSVNKNPSDAEFKTIGQKYGEKAHLLTGAESGEKGHNHTQNAHSHSINDPGHSHTAAGGDFATPSGSFYGLATATGYFTGSSTTGITINSATATNQAVASSNAVSSHNNIQPSIVQNFAIRY